MNVLTKQSYKIKTNLNGIQYQRIHSIDLNAVRINENCCCVFLSFMFSSCIWLKACAKRPPIVQFIQHIQKKNWKEKARAVDAVRTTNGELYALNILSYFKGKIAFMRLLLVMLFVIFSISFSSIQSTFDHNVRWLSNTSSFRSHL